jgi:hypothetical protein
MAEIESKTRSPSLGLRLISFCVALPISVGIWIPCVHLLYAPPMPSVSADAGVRSTADQLATHQLRLWTNPDLREASIDRMRSSNAEWDFMGRTFFVMALANRSLREPRTADVNLQVMDRIIDETLRLEEEKGLYFFLMPYAEQGQWKQQPPRSLFLDGEIALMLACRCVVTDNEAYRDQLKQRVELMIERMENNPVLCMESYPDECWMFCNAVALAAIRMHDYLSGDDHRAFFQQWLDRARDKLVHPETGLLVSSFTLDGHAIDGPEGSSIWMAAHCLQLVAPEFAADQYRRARKEIGVTIAGFGYAKEWPAAWTGPTDVDSGPIIPVLEVSAGSSGLALVGAAAFEDSAYLRALVATLDFAAFPIEDHHGLRYGASNQVGDAVMLYATTLGPLWKLVGPPKY